MYSKKTLHILVSLLICIGLISLQYNWMQENVKKAEKKEIDIEKVINESFSVSTKPIYISSIHQSNDKVEKIQTFHLSNRTVMKTKDYALYISDKETVLWKNNKKETYNLNKDDLISLNEWGMEWNQESIATYKTKASVYEINILIEDKDVLEDIKKKKWKNQPIELKRVEYTYFINKYNKKMERYIVETSSIVEKETIMNKSEYKYQY